MQELRLVGVHEDGEHLLLADEQGARFQVPVDDTLRAAVRHHPTSSGRAPGEASADVGPREVQAMIRAGLTTEEVAERSGWTVEKVRRYEVPILAEREYVTGLARLVRLRHRGSTAQPTLAARVAERLRTRGVDVETVRWDSFRPGASDWTVAITFAAGGRRRQATWAFDPVSRVLHAQDDEARWLSEDDPSPAGPLGREVPVYDVEADGGVQVPRSPRPASPASPTATSPPVDLVTAMRQGTSARLRGGARRRADTVPAPTDQEALPAPTDSDAPPAPTGQDALPASTDREVLPAPTGQEALPAPTDRDALPGSTDREALPAAETPVAALPPLPQPGSPPGPDAAAQPAADGVRDDSVTEPETEPTQHPARPARSPRRSSRTPVPAWKDVMLGTKPASD